MGFDPRIEAQKDALKKLTLIVEGMGYRYPQPLPPIELLAEFWRLEEEAGAYQIETASHKREAEKVMVKSRE